jgi:hypothetical protein
MARVLDDDDFSDWFSDFLPGISQADTLVPANVSDRSDPKIVHIDGLNLSRAWSLYVISSLKGDTSMKTQFRNWAKAHLDASLPHVASTHYEGSHWLGSFAVYALTRSD